MIDKERITRADELKTSGLKATLPRVKVLEIFQRSEHRHLSAEDVYKLLLDEDSDIGLATVYRVLMQFAQAGLCFAATSIRTRRCSSSTRAGITATWPA